MLFLRKVNRCDLASAKLGLKATRQENHRLLLGARRQASRVRDLEVGRVEFGSAVDWQPLLFSVALAFESQLVYFVFAQTFFSESYSVTARMRARVGNIRCKPTASGNAEPTLCAIKVRAHLGGMKGRYL